VFEGVWLWELFAELEGVDFDELFGEVCVVTWSGLYGGNREILPALNSWVA